MAANSEEQENYWPGYVDALTTMTMVLTFVMMVLGISIFTLSQNVSRSVIEKIATAAKVEPAAGGAGTDALAERIVARLETLQEAQANPVKSDGRQLAERGRTPVTGEDAPDQPLIRSDAPAPAEVKAPALKVDVANPLLRIVFQPRSTLLDDAAREQLVGRLGAMSSLADARRIDVLAGLDPGVIAVSDAKRVAFYRAMRARSELIQQGVRPDRVHVRIDPGTPGDDVLIRVTP